MKHKKISLLTILSCLLLFSSIAVKASTFSLIGGTPGVLPGNWNPSPNTTGLLIGNNITIFDKAGEGVWLNGAADLKYTYIGKEAGSTNASSTSIADQFFITGDTPPGTTFETTASSAGFLDFIFEGLATCCVLPGTFTNGLGNDGENGHLSLAVAMFDKSTLYLMFGDGFGDVDFDDMVVKVEAFSAVPVPAAFWLFGTALIGFVGISRRTRVS